VKKTLLLLVLGLMFSADLKAAERSPSRTHKPFGAIISFAGEPFPAGIGYNLAFNPMWYSRISMGYSDTNWEKVYGASARFFPLRSKFSPMYAICASMYTADHNAYPWNELKNKQMFYYSLLGFDLQSYSGFNLSFGVRRGHWRDAGTGIFIDMGWFFGFKKNKETPKQESVPVEAEVKTSGE
jgi:hypothetical protein